MSLVITLADALFSGLKITLEVTLFSAILAFVVAFAAGIARIARQRWIRAIAAVYVEGFRSMSALVVMFWLYFALPLLGLQLTALQAGVLALGLSYGAYGAEIVRGAIIQVPRGQWEAATAVNMSPGQRMRYVVLPQAILAMLPPLSNLLVDLVKATSLVALITLADLTFEGKILQGTLGHPLEIFALVLVVYFVINFVLTRLVRLLERRVSHGQRVGRLLPQKGQEVTVT
jgi:polar amino acid transport system permease protein